ncbi:MAG TPA: KH domain-containing protein [Chthoniobacterales bacterium]
MESFLEFVVRQLVEAPDEVVITRFEQGRKLVFKIEMRPSDVGRVIGRNGHTITALRSLLSAAAARTEQQVALQVVE